jgi:hypothetical protein
VYYQCQRVLASKRPETRPPINRPLRNPRVEVRRKNQSHSAKALSLSLTPIRLRAENTGASCNLILLCPLLILTVTGGLVVGGQNAAYCEAGVEGAKAFLSVQTRTGMSRDCSRLPGLRKELGTRLVL